jgi:hypothetical protein
LVALLPKGFLRRKIISGQTLIQAGYTVIAWDISPTALAVAGGIGVIPADGPGDLARRCATVITALPGIDAGTWSVSPAAWIGASNCPDGFSSGRHGE